MERPDDSQTVYSFLQHFQPKIFSVEKSFFMLQKLLAKNRNFDRNCKIVHDFTFQFLHVMISELAAKCVHITSLLRIVRFRQIIIWRKRTILNKLYKSYRSPFK